MKEAGHMIALDHFAVNDPREALTELADMGEAGQCRDVTAGKSLPSFFPQLNFGSCDI
jgi:hypothetical protein